jgi:cation:H+ antiporter
VNYQRPKKEGESGRSFGHALCGKRRRRVSSNVFSVLGIGAAIRPLAVSGAALKSTAWLAVLVVVTVAALWSGRKPSRTERSLFALSAVVRWVLGLLGILG